MYNFFKPSVKIWWPRELNTCLRTFIYINQHTSSRSHVFQDPGHYENECEMIYLPLEGCYTVIFYLCGNDMS